MSETTTPPPRPLPALQGLTGEFYAWCRQGELRFQRCDACETWRHVPREIVNLPGRNGPIFNFEYFVLRIGSFFAWGELVEP